MASPTPPTPGLEGIQGGGEGIPPIDIEIDNGGATYVGVWQRNTDGLGWASRRQLTDDEFHANWDEYRKKGYRPINQDSEVIRASRSTLDHCREQGTARLDFESKPHQRSSPSLAEHKAKYKPIDIDAIEVGGKMLLFEHLVRTNRTRAGSSSDMTPDTMAEFRRVREKGYRVADLDRYARNNQLTYAAIG